jgi:photosystem II stability/assembly factor-like uncharacterized protein
VLISLDGMTFSSDGRTGWAVGGGRNDSTILTTRDGGVSWTQQASPTTNHLEGVAFVDQRTGWAVGGSWPLGENHEEGTILHTDDGGNSWTRQSSGTKEGLFVLAVSDHGRSAWAVSWCRILRFQATAPVQ